MLEVIHNYEYNATMLIYCKVKLNINHADFNGIN